MKKGREAEDAGLGARTAREEDGPGGAQQQVVGAGECHVPRQIVGEKSNANCR